MKLLREIRLRRLQRSGQNTCSIQHYYDDPTTWYIRALQAIGYRRQWCPEGLPKPLTTISVLWLEDLREFYEKAIQQINQP